MKNEEKEAEAEGERRRGRVEIIPREHTTIVFLKNQRIQSVEMVEWIVDSTGPRGLVCVCALRVRRIAEWTLHSLRIICENAQSTESV